MRSQPSDQKRQSSAAATNSSASRSHSVQRISPSLAQALVQALAFVILRRLMCDNSTILHDEPTRARHAYAGHRSMVGLLCALSGWLI